MSRRLLSIYHRLPEPTRSLAASLRGFYLRSWRYGPETEKLVEEALDREHWTPQQWKTWQEERLALILNRAATRVPYYRDLWAERRRKGDRASWEDLENWPILDKEPLRENPANFLTDDCNRQRLFHENTSGTTGKPLDLWLSRKTLRAWYALFEARCRRWYGVSRHDRWAILGGQLITPVNKRRPPFWVWNAALNQLYMSSYHLAPDLIPHYLEALQRYRITYLLGYTSALHALAQEALRLRRSDLKMAVVITNAEPVFDYQRKAIAEAFQCPVRETYGMAEIVAAASECQEGRLHLWPDTGWIEILQNNNLAAHYAFGEIVSTGLLNEDMPLVRYRTGDCGTLSANKALCSCGRTLPHVSSLEGRVDDLIYTADGRRVGRLDPVFKASLPIREAQVIQEALGRLRVRYVPASDFSPEAAHSIIEGLKARIGETEVILEPVDEIPRGPNGKFRAVICQLATKGSADKEKSL